MTARLTRRRILGAALAGAAATAAPRIGRADEVQIDYWQYFFKQRVEAIDELIKRFETANPGIKVRHTHFPYAQYRTKVGAAVPAGEGPDVVQLYYGWLRDYRRAGLIQPLPSELFPAAQIDASYLPIVRQMSVDGVYYALPTAVRSLGLFCNMRLFREAGLPERTPATLDEMLGAAKAIVKRDGAGNITTAGVTIGLPSQDYHWWREVLVRQFGGQPFSDDYRKVTYGDGAGAAALTWYTDLQKRDGVALAGFMSEPVAAFRAGRAGLYVDGSFRVGTFQAVRGLDWSVGELPSHNGVRANFSSYWVNGLAAGAKGAKRDAALKFLAFITTDEAMALWLEKTGELPAKTSAALKPANLANPQYGPLIKGLDYAVATDFVDEDAQRAIFTHMLDRVLIQNQDALAAVKEAAQSEQALLDNYYSKG